MFATRLCLVPSVLEGTSPNPTASRLPAGLGKQPGSLATPDGDPEGDDPNAVAIPHSGTDRPRNDECRPWIASPLFARGRGVGPGKKISKASHFGVIKY